MGRSNVDDFKDKIKKERLTQEYWK
jgi:hypothetical protein